MKPLSMVRKDSWFMLLKHQVTTRGSSNYSVALIYTVRPHRPADAMELGGPKEAQGMDLSVPLVV